MTTPATAAQADSTDPEWTGIRTLGHANRFAVWDSEFRYDGRIRVPMGVKISTVRYSYTGNGQAGMNAVEVKRGRSGIDQEYEVIDLTFLADADLITFTLRGDLNVDADPRPAYSRRYQIRVDVTLDNGDVRTANPEIEVLAGAGRGPTRRRWDGRSSGCRTTTTGAAHPTVRPDSATYRTTAESPATSSSSTWSICARANRTCRATTATTCTTSSSTRTAHRPTTPRPRSSRRRRATATPVRAAR